MISEFVSLCKVCKGSDDMANYESAYLDPDSFRDCNMNKAELNQIKEQSQKITR